ncbi:MAG TPA: DNA replication and repair protein RecF [Vicinamibacteria bacterium]|nr:DNA replication and repair protein RecF [Vicinamibacteria bacterium]
MTLGRIEVEGLRVIRRAELELSSGLNVFVGRNAQGKTSVLEAVGLLARGRSFRTEETRSAIRRGAAALRARGELREAGTRLEVTVSPAGRRLAVDGREVTPAGFCGRVDVIVYATERLRVIRGPMRERRQFLDRGAAALWPSYRRLARDYERVVAQRNAALRGEQSGRPAWDERLVETGAALRQRRSEYAARLSRALERGFTAAGERYGIELMPAARESLEAEARALALELDGRVAAERRARMSLAGPHRDQVRLTIDGEEAAQTASAGQARSALLALALAAAEVVREERGTRATLLLDDLDSELDEERTRELCARVASEGQALVTTAHPGWAERLDGLARRFLVEAGEVRPA